MERMSYEYHQMQHSNASHWNENTPSKSYTSYGPIRFYGRKGKAPTLSTGRRSKFEQLHGEELIQREYRREKNRLLSKKLKEKRETILTDLLHQTEKLEKEHSQLLSNIEQLKLRRENLARKLESINQDPLYPLIYQTQFPLFFEQNDDQNFDTNSIIDTLSYEESIRDDFSSEESTMILEFTIDYTRMKVFA